MSRRLRDVLEAKGCPGGQGMSRRPRDVQEAKGCPGGQGMPWRLREGTHPASKALATARTMVQLNPTEKVHEG